MDNQLTFSVWLGLTDFVNPISYTFLFVFLLKHLKGQADTVMFRIFKIGIIIALTGGYIIPTGKVIVGLGLFDFIMPVPVVHFVNTGFLISGLTLFLMTTGKTYRSLPKWLDFVLAIGYVAAFALICIFVKYNTAAVLTGAIGIILIYVSIILMSIKAGKKLPIFLCAGSFCLTIFLSGIGAKADLYSPLVHWIIELTQITNDFLPLISVLIIFHKSQKTEQVEAKVL